jgi:hypothetical protein
VILNQNRAVDVTDAPSRGWLVHPLTEPSGEEKAAKWDKSEPPQVDKDRAR